MRNWVSLPRSLTVKSKLIIVLLLVVLTSVIVVAYVGGVTERAALNEAAFNQLVNRRTNKADQVKLYLESLRSNVAVMSQDRAVVAATMGFRSAYERFDVTLIDPTWDVALRTYYAQTYVPALSQRLGIDVALEALLPTSRGARFLQYHYTINTTAATETAVPTPDTTLYRTVHTTYDPQLRAVAQRFGFSDLLLVDYTSENVIYTLRKTPELGTSLRDGPYSQTHLAEIVRSIKRALDTSGAPLVDFASYPPAIAAPVAFVGSPVYNPSGQPIGLLVAQFTPEAIDRIVTDDRTWRASGQGTTGETYIVGPDLRMRTTSRFLVEDRTAYLADLRGNGQNEQTIALIEQLGTSIMLQQVATPSATEALAGRSDVRIVPDYRGRSTLTTYGPLSIAGLNWAVISQLDEVEAFAPVTTLQTRIFIVSVILIMGVTLLAIAVSSIFTRPIHRLTTFVQNVSVGSPVAQLPIRSEDEFGQLTRTINGVAQQLQQQTDVLQQRTRENEILLHSILPAPVVQRIQLGEARIADTLPHVSVLCAKIDGLTALIHTRDAQGMSALVGELYAAFDGIAEHAGLERQRTVGATYLAVCGLTTAYLDHPTRAVNVALKLFDHVEKFNEQHQTGLGLSIGIQSGSIVAGLLGGTKFMYNLWGETVNTALQLQGMAERNTILISDSVYARLDAPHRFVRQGEVDIEEGDTITTWVLSRQVKLTARQIELVQTSFAKLLPIGDAVAEQFYKRLFELAPSVQPLFRNNLQQQQRKLMNMLNMLVGSLNIPDKIVPILQQLAQKHVRYGAHDEHYAVVGDALLWTLAKRLPKDFTPEVEDAWVATYNLISELMVSATKPEAASRQTDDLLAVAEERP